MSHNLKHLTKGRIRQKKRKSRRRSKAQFRDDICDQFLRLLRPLGLSHTFRRLKKREKDLLIGIRGHHPELCIKYHSQYIPGMEMVKAHLATAISQAKFRLSPVGAEVSLVDALIVIPAINRLSWKIAQLRDEQDPPPISGDLRVMAEAAETLGNDANADAIAETLGSCAGKTC